MPQRFSFPKGKIKVLLLENVHPEAVRILQEEGYPVESLSHGLSEDELIEKMSDVMVLGVRSKVSVTKKVLERAPMLRVVGSFCIGMDKIDFEECLRRGVVLFNAPYSNSRSVVELVIGNIIMLMRGVFDKSRALHNGQWTKTAENSFEVRGKTLGIVGYGNIGSQLSVLAEAMGMEVYFYDLVDRLPMGNAKQCASLEEMLPKCDVVTMHVDGRKDNDALIGEREISMMKNGVIFLNLSRGFVVDTEALGRNIKSGKVRGAAVDVFPTEPQSNKEEMHSALQGLPNVILTPHIGGATQEAQNGIAHYVSGKIINYINTGSTSGSVNFPEIQLQEVKGRHRVIHIHENTPGILSKINEVIANFGGNIVGQYLKTNEIIGYVIIDIEKLHENGVIDGLKKIPGTIFCRILY